MAEARSQAPDVPQFLLTVNQVVSHNLARARRSRGWTQEEAAERLEAASGKRWTAATLSASERAVSSGRPRVFDANELVTFSRVYEYPVAYFLLPLNPEGKRTPQQFLYQLSRGDEEGNQTDRLLESPDLLNAVVPLHYPPSLVEEVNQLLRSKGLKWTPSSHVEWEDGSDDYESWRHVTRDGEDDLTLDDWQAVVRFASLMEKRPAAQVYRLLADALERPTANIPLEETPF